MLRDAALDKKRIHETGALRRTRFFQTPNEPDFNHERHESHEMMLCEDCAGYLRDADRQYPAMVRLAVRRFLLEFRHGST